MKRTGLVREIKGDEALICPADGGECGTCEARHACITLSGGKEEDNDFWVQNSAGAAPGDLIELELKSSASITIILSTFLIPVFMLFAGYLFMMNGTDSMRALGAGIGLIAGIAAALLINKRLGFKKAYNMQMTKIIEKADNGLEKNSESTSQMEGRSP